MAEQWKSAKASDVQPGDTVRTEAGEVVVVTRIETAFLGRPNRVAFIEDTPQRWYKRPVAHDANLEILIESDKA